jgi:hypothetical protein
MITPQEFLDRWDKETYGLVEYDEQIIHSLSLAPETKKFLTEAGLPESASPFITFESSNDSGGHRLTEKYEDADAGYRGYIYVGFTGSGHPICIMEENDKVLYIDLENDHAEVFINSSIAQFAESLLAFVDFVNQIKAVNGRSAFLERNAPKESLDRLADKLKEIDSASLTEGSFWDEEVNHFKPHE